MIDLVVVDGSNLYNRVEQHLITIGVALPEAKEYLASWFDVDRLIGATTGTGEVPLLGHVMFHSDRRLGKTLCGCDEVAPFWARQGANPFSSTELVRLTKDPGEGKESGVDMSIATFLFETADRWNSVCIVSDDSDFEPVVRHMKRRGKQVFCVVSPNSTSALVQVCTSHYPLSLGFAENDFLSFEWVRAGGVLDRHMTGIKSKIPPNVMYSVVPSGGLVANGWNILDIHANPEEVAESVRQSGFVSDLLPHDFIAGVYVKLEGPLGRSGFSHQTIGPKMRRLTPAMAPFLSEGVTRHFGQMTSSASWTSLMDKIHIPVE